MGLAVEMDQFLMLEEKIDVLIKAINALTQERDSLKQKLQAQQEKTAQVSREMEELKAARDNAKQRITSLLDKIEKVNFS
jgi:FtsZ-binding cell division protein ZapB